MTKSDLVDNFIYYMAFGSLLANKCQRLLIDPKVAYSLAAINQIDIERDILPGGKYFKKCSKQVDKYSAMVRGFSEEGAYSTAIIAFGPEGIDFPKFMIPREKK